MGSAERSALQSPAAQNEHHGSKVFHNAAGGKGLKYKGVNISQEPGINTNDRFTPIGKDGSNNRKVLNKRQEIMNPAQAMI